MSDVGAALRSPDNAADPEHPNSSMTDSSTDAESKPVDKSKNKNEHYRLGARSPLKTLLILSSGPLVSQIVTAIYGIVTSMWMGRAMGDLGIAATAVFTNLDNCGRAFGFFMNCAASSKISALLGEDRGDEAGQILCDLLRFCFVCGAVCPAIFIPACQPLAKWFGAAPEVTHYGFLYLAPLLGCSTITCFYLLICGALQAEGRTLLAGGVQIASLIANMALFNPLFLLVFQWKTTGAAIGTILSELIPRRSSLCSISAGSSA
jgi:Na+-driven multidrug efflux pump